MYFRDPYIELLDKSESEIADSLSIGRDDMRRLRNKMVDGEDYTREIHNKVKYTPTGLEKVLQYAGLRVDLTVNEPVAGRVKAFPANRNLMIVELEDGREVRARVKANHSLKVGMPIMVRREPGGIFILASPYPGKSKFVTVIK